MERGMMDTHPHPGSGAASPSGQQFSDLFPLDFLSFVEASSPSINNIGMGDFSLPEAGPSNQLGQQQQQQQSYASPIFDGRASNTAKSPSDASGPSRGGSSRGRARSKAPKTATGQGKRKSQLAQTGNGSMGMDLDQEDTSNGNGGEGGNAMSPQEMAVRMANAYGLQGTQGLDAFMEGYGQISGMSQGMLQQFEGIHMQSPIVFDPSNPSQPYNPMAQFLANSPHVNGNGDGQRKGGSINVMNGLITPGASTEMYPQVNLDQMSPMQLEMLGRREQMEGMGDLNMVPLLSPALNHHNSSQYASPPAFPFANKSPLEALQEQQRQFQDQLNALQVQQRQLQATAAAVAAATSTQTSPYINAGASGFASSSGSSGYSRPVTTPGMPGNSAEPSPQYFTPLSSPALEATRQFASFGHGANGGHQRHPHPLSALSSPALNPLGSAGGAQQTLSPALHPQSNGDLSDPEYIRALVAMLDTSSNNGIDPRLRNGDANGKQPFQSPSYPFQTPHSQSPLAPPQLGLTPLLTPGSGSSNGTGPHRHPLPAKSRPSPLVKPVNHRSHIRQPSTQQSFSQPSSPAVLKGIQPGTYLPAAAIGSSGYANGNGSVASTPSPVDLASIMPPPPVPTHHAQRGLTPMTPAALMNLGSAGGRNKLVLPKPDASNGPAKNGNGTTAQRVLVKRVAAVSGSNSGVNGSALGAAGTPAGTAGKKGKIVTGKKLAARPSGVGVRAATKGAAAAALQPAPEPENRRTSHKAAEQKRRDSLKAGFDELRLLLPPINTEALDPESGEPLPGSSAPRLLPKSSLVPDDNPNRGVSKVALLKFGNEYIAKLHEKVDRRDDYIQRLRAEVTRLRTGGAEDEVKMEEGGDLLEFDITAGEEEEEEEAGEEGEDGDEGGEREDGEDDGDDLEELEEDEGMDDPGEDVAASKSKKGPRASNARRGGAVAKRPAVGRSQSSGTTTAARSKRGD